MAHKYIPKKRSTSPLKYAQKAAWERDYELSEPGDIKENKLISKTTDIVERYGKGSRKGQEAIKKYRDYLNSPGRKDKRKSLQSERRENIDLIKEYGADAMQARGFGTAYPKVKRKGGGPAKKRKKKSKAFSGDDFVKKVNHYKDM